MPGPTRDTRLGPEREVMDLARASSNQIVSWLRRIEELRTNSAEK